MLPPGPLALVRAAAFVVLSLISTPLLCVAAPPADHAALERLLNDGRVDEVVRSAGTPLPADGAMHLLLCRAYYAEALPDPAVRECETALQSMGNDSQAHDWMGRTYGLKARMAGALTAMKWARKVKASFERAYQLDPHNQNAARDLGEFYLDAPSFVGGGLDLADDLQQRISPVYPEAAHRLRGLIAEKRHDYATAEKELRAAAETANRPEAWVDLGAYYFRRSDGQKAVSTLEHAVALDTRHGPATVDAGTLLEENHWGLDRSKRWLRLYLDGPARAEAAPTFVVQTRLAIMLKKDGEIESAKIEIRKALELASGYAPALKLQQNL